MGLREKSGRVACRWVVAREYAYLPTVPLGGPVQTEPMGLTEKSGRVGYRAVVTREYNDSLAARYSPSLGTASVQEHLSR